MDYVSFFTDEKLPWSGFQPSRVQRNNHFCCVQRRSCKQFPTRRCEPKGMAQNCEAEAENISCCVMTRMVNPVGPTAVVHITPIPFWTKITMFGGIISNKNAGSVATFPVEFTDSDFLLVAELVTQNESCFGRHETERKFHETCTHPIHEWSNSLEKNASHSHHIPTMATFF